MMLGNANGYGEFFPEELIPDALGLVLTTWRNLPESSKVGKEDAITGCLASAIKRQKKARRLAFSVHFQAIPLGENGPLRARIDFKFLAGFDEDAYLAFECKRLRIQRPSGVDHNCDSYVGDDGMGRFLCGKYGAGQNHGAMIGYIMDGDVAAAKSELSKAIQKLRSGLRITDNKEWECSTFLPDEGDIRQTVHLRKGKRFCIQHLLLKV